MSKLKIYTFPDLVLKQKATPIGRVEKNHQSLAENMLETMYDAPGIGLAANQVGILDRIIVVDTHYEPEDPQDFERDDEEMEEPVLGEVVGTDPIARKRDPIILINPVIIHREGSIVWSEGCLSVPEYTADVKRSEKIKIEYQDLDGLKKTLSAEGLQAVCLQHEIDHLDGKLYIDRISPLKRELIQKKLIKQRKQEE